MFDELFVPEAVLAELSDTAWVQAMLDVERALAVTEASLGLIPARAAGSIAAACRATSYDVRQVALEGRRAGNPAEALVRALRSQVGGEDARYVHRGATSQDIVDSAAMLVSERALALVLADLSAVVVATAGLAHVHRETLMAARTLLQQALPTTFGLKAAGWLVALIESQRLLVAARGRLALQLGGAAGTLASLGTDGPAVARGVAVELGLAEPVLPWHTARGRIVELGSALAAVSGALAKIALDVVLLSQTEVGEVAEPAGEGRGSSSTLPHKRNPVGSTIALACARRVQGHASVLVSALPQEHERAAGAWHAEWDALSRALAGTAGAAASMRTVLEGLEVRAARMRENLDLSRGLIMSERVQQLLDERVGHEPAREIVSRAARRAADRSTAFRAELEGDERMPLSALELDLAFDAAGYLGSSEVFVDRALALYESTRA